MQCQDCHLGKKVPKLIDKYTCGLDHNEEKTVRNAWDGCDIVESVRAREHASKLECPKCGSDYIFIETRLPVERVVVERPYVDADQSTLKDSKLVKTADPERTFQCQQCEHSWPVPDWFPEMWKAKPEDVSHMTFEELQAHLRDKILGGLQVPAGYVGGIRRALELEQERLKPKPIPEFTDEELLTPAAWAYIHRSPELERRVIDALYESSAPYMPENDPACVVSPKEALEAMLDAEYPDERMPVAYMGDSCYMIGVSHLIDRAEVLRKAKRILPEDISVRAAVIE